MSIFRLEKLKTKVVVKKEIRPPVEREIKI
jgi:hypothetical protein